MCEICRQTPHHPLCPYAPEPQSVFVCSGCDRDIFEGEFYYDILGEQFCDDCIEKAKKEAVYDPD